MGLILNSDKIADLKENEVAGCQTINAILAFLRNIKSDSDSLTINSNADGGITFSFNADPTGSIDIDEHDFQVTDTSTNSSGKIVGLTLSSGHVVCPSYDYSVSSRTLSVSSGQCVYVQVTASGASIMAGVRPAFCEPSARIINVPIITMSSDGTSYRYNHIGSVEFANTPYVHVAGYSISDQYSRDILDGVEVYTKYEQCDDDREEEL